MDIQNIEIVKSGNIKDFLGVPVTYVSLAKKYIGMSDVRYKETIWPFHEYFLHQPLTVARDVLRSVLPKRIHLESVIERTRIKQKEIASKIKANMLPADRPPGYIGQIALFEALSENRYDVSYIFDRNLFEWDKSGFLLLYHLLSFQYLANFFQKEDIDISSFFLKSITTSRIQNRQDQLWMDRIIRSRRALFSIADLMSIQCFRQLTIKLYKATNHMRISPRIIAEWCKCSIRDAKQISNIMYIYDIAQNYKLHASNIGAFWSIDVGHHSPSSDTCTFMRCTNIETKKIENIRVRLKFTDQNDDMKCTKTVYSWGIHNYDSATKRWVLNSAQPTDDKYSTIEEVGHIPENHIPKNDISPSSRDIYIVALLLSWFQSDTDQLGVSIPEFLIRYCSLSKRDVSNGLRGVFRKGLLIPSYKLDHLANNRIFQIISIDRPKKLVPYLISIMKSTPRCGFRINDRIDRVYGFTNIPDYLAEEFLEYEKRLKESLDIDRMLHEVHQVQKYNTSSLLTQLQNLNE